MNASAALPWPAWVGSIRMMSPGSMPSGHATSMACPSPVYQACADVSHYHSAPAAAK